MLKTQEIKNILRYSNHPFAKYYTQNMEVQINVAQDDGKRVSGEFRGKKWKGWTDGIETWKSFRIPWNADISPEYKDSDINFDLSKHTEAIGMTGWDWENKESIWVGFDFDALINHKSGISNEDLQELIERTSKVPWVTLLRSTSGKGIHLYLKFDNPPETKTHHEHSAIARSLLSVLTADVGFDFKAKVDCVGSVLWVYHRKAENTEGFTLIKQGTDFPVNKIPNNWREHLSVISEGKKRTQITGKLAIPEAMKNFYFEEGHRKILKWFSDKAKKDWWWDTDNSMLVCHTFDLRDCYEELGLRGVFKTESSGSSEQNSFAFPVVGGGFIVRRHGKNVSEAPTWATDEKGWTKCHYNLEPNFREACYFFEAMEDERSQFIFQDTETVEKVFEKINLKLVLPEEFKDRQVILYEKKDKIIIKIDKYENDGNIKGFLLKAKVWIKVIKNPKIQNEITTAPDELIRHTISGLDEAGWFINIEGKWISHPKGNVTTVLCTELPQYTKNEIEMMMGKSILKPWELVNLPFEDEYPGDRKWNKDGALFSCQPKKGTFPHWEQMLTHLGSGLDEAVLTDKWCKINDIKTGGEYLFVWLAFMFQKPSQSLPYLFFVGQQKTGKSTFHEALYLLFKNGRGYARADQALKSNSGFNGEIAHSVLCVVEETDLSNNIQAMNRMKDWVTGETIAIRELYKNAYNIRNNTHWAQFANDITYCPVFNGDTRIVMINVPPFKDKEIPKHTLLEYFNLEKEAFLYEILDYELPELEGRLGVPVLNTELKTSIIESDEDPLKRFLIEKCYNINGELMTIETFYSYFDTWLKGEYGKGEAIKWDTRKLSREFPISGSPNIGTIVRGKHGSSNKIHIGNISFDDPEMVIDAKKYMWKKNLGTGRLEKRRIEK